MSKIGKLTAHLRSSFTRIGVTARPVSMAGHRLACYACSSPSFSSTSAPASSPLFHISENCRLSHLVRARALLLWLSSQGPAYPLCCTSAGYDGDAGRKPARLAQKQKTLEDLAEYVNVDEPVPQVTLEHVNVSFARSGGPGGQNVNKVNTKVDMRFKVMEANWLPERIRLKLLQRSVRASSKLSNLDVNANRINSEGELVVSSTRTRTQKYVIFALLAGAVVSTLVAAEYHRTFCRHTLLGNIEDALCKIQELITAAAYVPPPPSDEKIKRINKLAKIENERRLQDKKRAGSKKSERRNKGSWD